MHPLSVALREARGRLRRVTLPSVGREFPFRAPHTPAGVAPVDKPVRHGPGYETDWARRFPARWTRAMLVDGVMTPTMHALARPSVDGDDRLADVVEAEQPVIFCANHHSHLDTPLLLSRIPEPWRHKIFVGAAADYFFTSRVSSAAAALALNAIPIDRTTVSRRSADEAAKLLVSGWSMLIFPEGGRSPDGWGQEFRGGAAYLSRRCDVPIVPVHIAGTDRILPKGAKRLRPGTATITFGPALWPDEDEDTRSLSSRIEAAVAALADEQTTDWYAARVRAHRRDSPSLSGPDARGWRRQWALGDASKQSRRRRRRWPDL